MPEEVCAGGYVLEACVLEGRVLEGCGVGGVCAGGGAVLEGRVLEGRVLEGAWCWRGYVLEGNISYSKMFVEFTRGIFDVFYLMKCILGLFYQ
ncbi:hypothetical protein [Bartonella krasnovii]|uniref:hypothetical protein n=1 Tax=Bartonella krasnovii TaxID=2267275 RepID=UPI001425AB03|nr:hypothetical protein [Bartonella krasnovii]